MISQRSPRSAPENPLEPRPDSSRRSRSRSRRIVLLLGTSLAAAALLGAGGWYKLIREVPQSEFAGGDYSPADYFKYGSIGAEAEAGIPYWIFHVLPQIFPEYLPGPGGYASLGVAWEPGRELPVGFSKKTIGIERVGINCALCHSATVNESADGVPTVYPAGPSHAFDALAYQRFLFSCASDPRFNAARILGEIAQVYELSAVDRWLYRWLLIPVTRKRLLEQKAQFAWTDGKPLWGRGRIDPFNPVKAGILDLDPGDTIGNSDMVPIWNLRPREGMSYHWDGLNDDLREVIDSSALGDGATPKSLPVKQLRAMQTWLLDLKPPAYPWPDEIDRSKLARGEQVFRASCFRCHGDASFREGGYVRSAGARVGEVEPLESVGTDPHRAAMWSQQAADTYNAYGARNGLHFERFANHEGYVNVPLDGLWIRAPYLHNGSVPTLRDLLEPPAERPPVFYRGSSEYDRERVGFVTSGAAVQRSSTRYDVSEAGNSNQGHLWGTDLGAEDKLALVEYLKTF